MKRSLAFAAALLAVSAAIAATSTTPIPAEAWTMKRDTTAFGPTYTTRDACISAARAHAETAHKSANYSCSDIRPFRVTYSTSAPPAACTAQPSTSTVTVPCAAGFAPPWQQTTTVTVAAPPACTVTTTQSPATAPAGSCLPIVAPPTGQVYYLSPSGNNSNAGTQASPKRDLGGISLNTLPAGSAVYFERGGTWQMSQVFVENLNATVAAPIVLDAYGTGARPALVWTGGQGFFFGGYASTLMDGGYTIRNLKLDGSGSAEFGLFVQGRTRGVTIENNEITGWLIGVHMQAADAVGNQGIVIRSNNIHHNRDMGVLGESHGLLMEDNDIADNNFSGSGFNHGLYLGSHFNTVGATVRNNRFTNNSAVNGVCQGGNLTVHGMWDGLLIEGNTVSQVAATYGCWGISVTDGYTIAEYFRNTIVRGNTVINMECGICARGAPGIIIENNKVRSNQDSLPSGVVITPPNEAQDDPGLNPVVRNNTFCFTSPNPNQGPVRVSVAGGTETGTVYRTGANATTGACAP